MAEQDVIAAMKAAPRSTVDLSEIKERATDLRNSYLRKNDLEQQLKDLDAQIKRVEREDLPELLHQAGVSSVTVEADGNHPAFVASLKTVYAASIPDHFRMDAFEWMEQNGHGDLVSSDINIHFGMHEYEKKLAAMKLLRDNGIEFYANESVHHMTLKAFVKRELQEGHVIPHDLLGVYVYDEVKIK